MRPWLEPLYDAREMAAADRWAIEDRGIDAAYFWQNLYYTRMAYTYEATRETNPVDMLASGIFAAHFVTLNIGSKHGAKNLEIIGQKFL